MIGQLGIPVRLYSATQQAGPTFVHLHDKDSSPVERPLFCKKEQKEIPYDEIIRGVEYETGKFVTFTDQELEQAGQSDIKAINIKQFGASSDIEPSYYEKSYFVVPTRGGERGYALLREGLSRMNVLAIGQFYFYGSERIGALEVRGDMIVMYRLRFTAELVPRSAISTPPLPRPSPQEIELIQAVIERHSGPLNMSDFHDEYAERIKLLSERKAKGLPMPRPERVPAHATPEESLQEALAQSLDGTPNLSM